MLQPCKNGPHWLSRVNILLNEGLPGGPYSSRSIQRLNFQSKVILYHPILHRHYEIVNIPSRNLHFSNHMDLIVRRMMDE